MSRHRTGAAIHSRGWPGTRPIPLDWRHLLRNVFRNAWRLIREDRFIYLVVALHAAAAVFLLILSGQTAALAFDAYLGVWPFVFFLQFPIVYGLIGILQVVHRFDRRRQLAFRHLFSVRRLSHFIAGAALLAAIMVFQGAFTSFKNVFPIWAGGFPFDDTLAAADRFIHLGHDPWTLLYAFARNDLVRLIVEWNYDHGWFVFCYVALFWVAVAPEADRIRTRYMMTYLATWIVIGNVMAGLFPAAGPAFFGNVTGDGARFGPQLAFLSADGGGGSGARGLQHYLWSLYAGGQSGFGSGISAFPSVHVALAMMNALFLFERSRRAGIAASAYVAFIAVSSVYLAWHYALDGYVAILVTVAIYALLRWWTAEQPLKAS